MYTAPITYFIVIYFLPCCISYNYMRLIVYIIYLTGESEEKRKTNKLTTSTTAATHSSKNNKLNTSNGSSGSGDIFMLSGATLTAGYCHMVVIAVGENSR